MIPIEIGYERGSREIGKAYDRIVSAMFMMKERRGMNSFVFTSCERQVGNTTVCVSLAAELARIGRKTLLADCDFLKPAEEKRLYQYVEFGLAEHINLGVPVENVIYETDIPKLYYISGGKRAGNPTAMLWSGRFGDFMKYAGQNYDFIIFDTAPVLAAPEVCVLAYRASGTALTVQCGRSRKAQIHAAKSDIEAMSPNFLGVIVNKTPRGEYKAYQDSSGFSAILRGPDTTKE